MQNTKRAKNKVTWCQGQGCPALPVRVCTCVWCVCAEWQEGRLHGRVVSLEGVPEKLRKEKSSGRGLPRLAQNVCRAPAVRSGDCSSSARGWAGGRLGGSWTPPAAMPHLTPSGWSYCRGGVQVGEFRTCPEAGSL